MVVHGGLRGGQTPCVAFEDTNGESLDKIERLINLTACLLETKRPLTFVELKDTVYRGLSRS